MRLAERRDDAVSEAPEPGRIVAGCDRPTLLAPSAALATASTSAASATATATLRRRIPAQVPGHPLDAGRVRQADPPDPFAGGVGDGQDQLRPLRQRIAQVLPAKPLPTRTIFAS